MTVAGVQGSPARSASIDVLRLVALLAVVVGHVYADDDLVERVVQSWRLPVFFMLSGYFWSVRRTLSDDVRRRARSLLLPYVVWVLLITVLVLASEGGGWAAEWRRVSTGVLLGGSYAVRPWTTVWFFTALFAAVVVYRLLVRVPVAVRLVVVLGSLVAVMVAGPELARVPFALGTAMSALVFVEAGRLVRLLQSTWPARRLVLAAAVSLLLALGLVSVPRDFVAMDIKYGVLPPAAVLAALLICSALLLAATAWTGPQGRAAAVATGLARPALVVIMAHPVVLAALPPEQAPLPLPAIVALAFVLPLLAGLVIVRTPLSPWLAGVPATPGQRRRTPTASPTLT